MLFAFLYIHFMHKNMQNGNKINFMSFFRMLFNILFAQFKKKQYLCTLLGAVFIALLGGGRFKGIIIASSGGGRFPRLTGTPPGY